ncbi:MAG: serine protein kinase PrkA, partial [Myxococcota bacterium]
YPSFKARMELVRLGYLRDYVKEQAIYDEQISKVDVGKFVAPHTTFVAALWAVLTRMMRPDPDQYPGALRDVVAKLTPLQKAELYAEGAVPDGLSQELTRELRHHVRDLMDEGAGTVHYEGRYGASPREMKMLLLNAAQNNAYPCLSPLAVLDELEEMVRESSVFTFLQVKADGEFFRHDQFIETVRERYLDLLDDELQDAMGLVDDQQYEDLFARYIDHVSQSLKSEKVYNQVTGNYEDPDEKFMEELEGQMGAGEDHEAFRQSLISSIAAAYLDDPEAPLDYRRTFPALFSSLKRSFFEDRQKAIRKTQEHLLVYFEGEKKQLSPQDLELVEVSLKGLIERFGHNHESAREAVAFLVANRYKE